MSRILVTGSAGFVGSHVMEQLRGTSHYVVPFDAEDSWDELGPVDVVISLAATADPQQALRDPVSAYENNVRVMVQTLEYARHVGARVLHVSTNEVYGHKVGFPYEPRGPYAGGKACQEIICEAYQDVPTTVVVTQSLFGERQQPDKLVPTAIRKLLAGEPIPLQRNNARWASRPFMHVRNLAEALLFLADDETGKRRRVHVGASQALSVRTMIDMIATTLERPSLVESVHAGDRPGHELDVEPIGCDLAGWEPTYNAMAAIQDVARWYRDNPRWLEPYALAGPHSAYPSPPREARRAA